MYLHEYQSKILLRQAGVPVPLGRVAFNAVEARGCVSEIPGSRWVVKAQAHTGGRGKAGGVALVSSESEAFEAADRMIGTRLVTRQSGPSGLPVGSVLVEAVRPIAREMYLCLLVDRSSGRLRLMASAAGGMDIEEVAAEDPDRIASIEVHPATGLQPFHGRVLGAALGFSGSSLAEFQQLLKSIYTLSVEKDLIQVEINPLIQDDEGHLMVLDAKIIADDNALGLHPDLQAFRDVGQEDAAEARARDLDLSYVTLDGNIGCMVNGAGLAMATVDVIQLHGGRPANFLDVGGGITRERVSAALDLILSEPRVKTVLVNMFGGIVRCDLIAEGIIDAVRAGGIRIPMIVRLEGTHAEEGRRLLEQSGLELMAAATLDEAASKAVEVAR